MGVTIEDETAPMLIEALHPGHAGPIITLLVAKVVVGWIVPHADNPVVARDGCEDTVQPMLHHFFGRGVSIAKDDVDVGYVNKVEMSRTIRGISWEYAGGIFVEVRFPLFTLEFVIARAEEELAPYEDTVYTRIVERSLPGRIATIVSEVAGMYLKRPVCDLVEEDMGNVRTSILGILS